MKRVILGLVLSIGILLASSFESMSNEELIALIGYVKPQESTKFMQELESRKPNFTSKERAQYEKNIQKAKK